MEQEIVQTKQKMKYTIVLKDVLQMIVIFYKAVFGE